MLPFLILTILSTSAGYQGTPSAASQAQIRFAIENKYDDTGPGAKTKEYAYNTFSTLDKAVVGYLDDPDTHLPNNDRALGLETFYNEDHYTYSKSEYNFIQNEAKSHQPQKEWKAVRKQSSQMHDPFKWQSPEWGRSWPLSSSHLLQRKETAKIVDTDNMAPASGDLKSSETRDGYPGHGSYSYLGADGMQHVVHYVTDDKGARSTVERTFPQLQQ